MSEIISKTMNSTLGTEKFRAFDELMRFKSVTAGDDAITAIAKTSNVVCSYSTNYNNTGSSSNMSSKKNLVSFRTTLQGTVKIGFNVRMYMTSSAPSSSLTGSAILYRNGVQNAIVNGLNLSGSGASSYDYNVIFNSVPIAVDDLITIEIVVTNSKAGDNAVGGNMTTTSPVTLSGTLSDYVPIRLEV